MARSEADAELRDLEQLRNEYIRMAEAANKRLQRLEQYAQQPGYENILSYAYKGAISDIKALRGEGYARFSRVPASSKRELKKQINIVKSFMETPSSTKRGITKIYKKRAESLSQDLGVKITWEDLRSIFETGLYDLLYQVFGDSKIVMKCIANITRNKTSLRKAIEQGRRVSFSGEHARDLTELFNEPANYRILADYLGYTTTGPTEEEEDELPF